MLDYGAGTSASFVHSLSRTDIELNYLVSFYDITSSAFFPLVFSIVLTLISFIFIFGTEDTKGHHRSTKSRPIWSCGVVDK